MSGRSRLTRNGTPHDVSSSRKNTGYTARSTTETSRHVRKGVTETGYGNLEKNKAKEGTGMADSVSRYTKPPRHDKDKVDNIRDEYLSRKGSNGDVTRVPVYTRTRASTTLDDTRSENPASSAATESLSRARSSSESSEDPETRKARIAKYKEQRRRELADKYGLKDSGSAATSSDSDPSATRHKRDWRSKEDNAGGSSYSSRMQTNSDSKTYRGDVQKSSLYSSKPLSPRSPRRTSGSQPDYQPLTKDALQASEGGMRYRSDSVSSTSSDTRARKDSVISVETQHLVDTLEASRAARRERMRRTVSDVSMDATERIIAKHRARKGSIDGGDNEVFSSISPAKKNAPEEDETPEGAPAAHNSDSDSCGSSTTTSGERLRSLSEPVDPATGKVLRRTSIDEYKPPSDRGVSTKQSRSRSRRQNVSITAAQIKEAHAIGQKLVERKLSLTESSQPSTSPSASDLSDTARKKTTCAIPSVSSKDEETQQVSTTKKEEKTLSSRDSSKSRIPTKVEIIPTERDSKVFSKTETIPVESTPEKKLPLDSTEQLSTKAVPENVSRVDSGKVKESPKKISKRASPRVTSPSKLESPKTASKEKKSQEKRPSNKSSEKTSRAGVSNTDSDNASASKVRPKRPEIPQVLNESRKRRNSNESSSSLSDGTMSPTHRIAKTKSSDSDSRASPTMQRHPRKITETSARIQELAKPKKVEIKKEPVRNGDAKKTERKTPTSPEKKIKAVTSHSKTENGGIADKNKGRDSPKLKEPTVSVKAKLTQKTPQSKDKITPPVKTKTNGVTPANPTTTTKIETPRLSKPMKESKIGSKIGTKIGQGKTNKPPEVKDKPQSSPKSTKPPEIPEKSNVKRLSLATKDTELIAIMRARALSLQDDDDDVEDRVEEDGNKKPDDIIKVPVTQRLVTFQTGDKLDGKPPMPPTSPSSPRSPRRSSQIKTDTGSPRPSTPVERSSEADTETDELATLSVLEKKHMFTEISKLKDEEAAKAKPRRRFHRVRHSERSQTQPVTPEEVSSASSLATMKASESTVTEINEVEVEEDDVCRLSLAEKMKLFHEKAERVRKPLPKMEAPKRKRRTDSRFKTQPVTIDEVKKASDFSPLARSFSRPPAEVANLPIAEQIAIVYGSSEKLERKGSLQEEKLMRRISETGSPEKKGILKDSSFDKVDSGAEEPPKGILKSDNETSLEHPPKGRGILKSEEVQSDPEVRSILKDRSDSLLGDSDETKGILRRDSSHEKDDTDSDRTEKSILKKESTSEKPPLTGIMRKSSDSAPVVVTPPKVLETQPEVVRPKENPRKATLRKEDSQDADVDSGTDDPIRKKSGLAIEQLRLRKGKGNLRGEAYSSSDSEPEGRIRAKSTPNSPIVEIRTVKKKQLPDLDIAKKRHKSPSPPGKGKDGKEHILFPRRLRSPDPGRYLTQPVTPEEMAKVKQLTETVKTSTSIADRLSSLKKSGQEDWQKRLNKYNDSPQTKLKDFLTVPGSGRDVCPTDNDLDLATCSISKRLELIQTSQGTWKKRVEEKDAVQFTVSGKMSKAGMDVVETSPQLKRGGSLRVKRGGSFRGRVTLNDKKDGEEKSDKSDKSEDKSDSTSSNTASVSDKQQGQSSSTNATPSESDSSECSFRIVKKKVAVMKPDGETFAEFFSSSSTIITEAAMLPRDRKASLDDVTVSDFDALSEDYFPKLTALSRNRMSLRPKRRAPGAKNPIRALKTRTNVISEYEEVKKEMIETQPMDRQAVMNSRRVELSSKSQHLSPSARKGLASKEDIAKGILKLQKVKDVREMEGKLSQLLPYNDKMLIQVKGRRFVQIRLIQPSADMLNTGDCFVLVTPKECYLWIGQYSNVIERSKASEMSQMIQSTRDLGCKAPSVVTMEESHGKPLGSSRDWKRFMEVLGGADNIHDIARIDDDELHEIYITETNMVYKVEGESLVPYDDYWGGPPKFGMLNSQEILVFDFGSELYIWQGKQTSSKERQTAAKLAQIVWERGYDYREFDSNPIWPGQSKKPMHGSARPDWALFGKTTQHMETVLFQNKFLDWPSETRVIKVSDEEQKSEPASELVPYDASKMIMLSKEKPDLILENTNLGRGKGANPPNAADDLAHFQKIDQRGNEIQTLSVVMWHIMEFDHSILPDESFGQFHEGDTYVVRWQYKVVSTGMRDLKGNLSKRGQGHGRERCAYFFWQGLGSTINEKGASALMTVELDDERGPQRQVIQGKEPPAFLQLFNGRMVIHKGKREDEDTNTSGPNKLYCVRSEHTEEGLLLETQCETSQLRSRTSFILLHLKDDNKATLFIWHGVKSSKASRATAVHAADMLKKNAPLEMGMKSKCSVTIEEMEEGKETNIFKKLIDLDRSSYDSAIGDPLAYKYTPRLFHLTSTSGVFLANELLNQSRSEDEPTPYPFLQTDLYGATQPAEFLFDNHYEVYLWQGWWPVDQNKKTGSAKMRWDIDRKCAMETVMAYCKEKRIKNPPKAYLVHGGLEPLTFTNLLPWWKVDNDVAEVNKKDGKRGDRAILVSEVLEKLSKAQFTFAELQVRPLPDGVDPMKLETYLSEKEFKEVLNMGRDEFYKMPSWKQIKNKKEVELF